MKKRILLCLIFVLAFFMGTDLVFAIDHDIVYNVDVFRIDSSNATMIVDGWAYIDHVDNIGGPGGNMKSYIIAYAGGTWKNSTDYSVACGENSKIKCVKFENPVYIVGSDTGVENKTYRSNFNMYLARCEVGGGGSCACKHSVFKNNVDNLKNSKKTISADCDGRYSGCSDCVYNNVSFRHGGKGNPNPAIDLKTVFTELAGLGEIKFKIYVETKYGTTLKNLSKAKSYRKLVDFGMTKGSFSSAMNCKWSGNSCTVDFDEPITVEKDDETYIYSSITINSVATTVKITAIGGLKKTNANLSNNSSELYPGVYDTIGNGLISDIAKGWHKGGYSIYTKAWGFKTSSGYKYYAPLAWGRIEPTVGIKVKTETKKKPNSQCVCFGENCVVTGDNPKSCQENEAPSSSTCESDSEDKCVAKKYDTKTCNVVEDGVYYYKVSSSDIEKKILTAKKLVNAKATSAEVLNGQKGVIKKGNYYYLPVTFYSNIQYSQGGELDFVKLGESGEKFVNNSINVDSGRFFNFGIKYTVNASWGYVNSTFKYHNKRTIKVKYGNTSSNIAIYFDFKDDEKIYDSVGNEVGKVSEIASKIASVDKVTNDDVQNLKNKLAVVFPSSNAKSADDISTLSPGSFECSTSSKKKNSISAICYYTIPQAYIDNNINKDASIYYGNNKYTLITENTGSLYYIPLYLNTGDKFEFDINGSNLGLIDDIKLSYSATCKLKKVTNQLKDRLNYRPIDVNVNSVDKIKFSSVSNKKSPNNVPLNWREYLYTGKGTKANFLRLQKSYNTISYQTYAISSKTVSKIRKYNESNKFGSYSDLTDIDKKGNSSVINSNSDKLFKIINGKHCNLGEWSASCDAIS